MTTSPEPYRTGAERTTAIVVTTGNDVAGCRVTSYLGIVRGIIVRSPNVAQSFLGGLKTMGGGNIKEFQTVCEAARHEAYVEMMRHAEALGAHAVIAMRYDATEFMGSTTEVLAYGTAVRLEQIGAV